MRWVSAICALLLSLASAHAAPSLLGICHKDFNCDGVNKLYSGQDKLVISYLENTFGNDCKCLKRLLNDPRAKVIRVHLIQSPCMRNKRCGRYEALWGYTAASANRAVKNPKSRLRTRFQQAVDNFNRRIAGVSNLTCYVSPCLECDLNANSRRILTNVVSAALPVCNVVDNPYRQRCLPGYTCEQHGVNPALSAPCIIDLDGIDGATIDLKKWVAKYKHCDLSFYWEPWMNCIRGKFVDPRSRNCSYGKSIFEGALCRSFLHPSSATCSR